MTELLRPRNPALDIAKGIAMLLVLYGHALGLFFEFGTAAVKAEAFPQLQLIYAFHMPLFYLLSGMVFRPVGLRETLRRSLALLFTAFIVHAVCWLGELVMAGGPPDLPALLLPLLRLRGFHSVIVWFLVSLALVQPCWFLLVRGGHRLRWPLALLLLAGFALSQSRGSSFWQQQSLLPGLLFFALGHWLSRHDLGAWVRGWRWPLLLPALWLSAWLARRNGGCGLHADWRCDNVPGGFVALMIAGQYGFMPWFLLAAVAGSLTVFCAAWVLQEHLQRLARLLAWTGRRSLQLLVVNGLVIFFVHPLFGGRLGGLGLAAAVGLSLALTAAQLLSAYAFDPVTSSPLRLARWLADRLVRQRPQAGG